MNKLLLSFILIFNFSVANADIVTILDGDKESKIKLIVFESMTCSHCADFHKKIYPNLKEDFIEKGLVSIEYKSFPLDLAALNASKIAHCKNDGDSRMLHFLYEYQDEWVKGNTIEELNENLIKILRDTGITLDFKKCIENKKIEDHILEDRIEGVKKYQINGTPTLIINGEKFENPLNYKKLKNYLEKLISENEWSLKKSN